MNVDSILLSEFASVDAGAKLSVINVYNRLNLEKVPVKVGGVFLTLVVHGAQAEAGRRYSGEIHVLDRHRQPTHDKPITFQLEFGPAESAIEGMPLRVVAVIRIGSLLFKDFGPHALEVYIDETYAASAYLYINQKLGPG